MPNCETPSGQQFHNVSSQKWLGVAGNWK